MNIWLFLAGLFGLLGVAMGAVGDHLLHDQLATQTYLTFLIGVRYQIWHTLALLGVAAVLNNATRPFARTMLHIAGFCFFGGMVLFCGGIYLLTIMKMTKIEMIIPVGGVVLLVGWVFILLSAFASKNKASPTAKTTPKQVDVPDNPYARAAAQKAQKPMVNLKTPPQPDKDSDEGSN